MWLRLPEPNRRRKGSDKAFVAPLYRHAAPGMWTQPAGVFGTWRRIDTAAAATTRAVGEGGGEWLLRRLPQRPSRSGAAGLVLTEREERGHSEERPTGAAIAVGAGIGGRA
jgi:hypothetical protein